MGNLRWLLGLSLLLSSASLAVARRSTNRTSPWKTLNGNSPLVVARGGFSGLFPDSSVNAYKFAMSVSVHNVILWCDVQLTRDHAGICFPGLDLDNASTVSQVFHDKTAKTYLVNGENVTGWFSVDFSLKELQNIFLTQNIMSRLPYFDYLFGILTVKEVAKIKQQYGKTGMGLWLNIEHDAFFSQHNLSMTNFLVHTCKKVAINYISSPEVNFLSSLVTRFIRGPKLVFRFLGRDDLEPSTNQTYGSLLKNLTFIKTFASGILVPKSYIWPVGDDFYLQPSTSLVVDAHRADLEVFASDFMNDVPLAYNYSYDPVTEYLSFVDNGNFSVDGVLSDNPITPSAAFGLISEIRKTGRAV